VTKEYIVDFLTQNKNKFEQKYHISRMAIFGSFAKGLQRENSDIDIVYTLSDGHKLSFERYLELENELASTFGTKIDLINETKLNPLVLFDAKKDFIYV